MALILEARKYVVDIAVMGTAYRVVRARSEEEALSIAKTMLLQSDGQTPKDNRLDAFCWDVWNEDAELHLREMTDAEIDELANKNLATQAEKDNTEPNPNPEQENDNDQG